MPPEARFTRRARGDVRQIAGYIARESGDLGIAERFVRQIIAKAAAYVSQPGAGSPAPGYKRGIRTFLVGNYLAFYRKRSFGIEVLKVVHGARNY